MRLYTLSAHNPARFQLSFVSHSLKLIRALTEQSSQHFNDASQHRDTAAVSHTELEVTNAEAGVERGRGRAVARAPGGRDGRRSWGDERERGIPTSAAPRTGRSASGAWGGTGGEAAGLRRAAIAQGARQSEAAAPAETETGAPVARHRHGRSSDKGAAVPAIPTGRALRAAVHAVPARARAAARQRHYHAVRHRRDASARRGEAA